MSDAIRQVQDQADTAARSDASVLIYGESGVGKEPVVRRIHEKSGRSGPFVTVNLSGLPEELFESEMQGYERGAFTGAFQRKIGLLVATNSNLFEDVRRGTFRSDLFYRMYVIPLAVPPLPIFCLCGPASPR